MTVTAPLLVLLHPRPPPRLLAPPRHGTTRTKARLRCAAKENVKEHERWSAANSYRDQQPPLEKKRAVAAPAAHTYRANGLLDVNPRGRHPIFELIELSETQRKRKVDCQSRTFKQAVEEYRRHYQRSPLKGFEIW